MPPPPNKSRVVSAERVVPRAEPAPRINADRLRESAVDTMLNGAGLLRDVWDDFKSSDRYFKYKAVVLACWLVLTVTSIGVACPTSGSRTNSFGARLVVAGQASAPVYMVRNDSKEAWHDVEVLVNGEYRSTAAQVNADREITLSPLYTSTGSKAPADLRITEIEVQIGDEKVSLLQGGEPQ